MAPFASSFSPRRANRPFFRLSPSECEFRSDFGRLVRLDGQIVFKKSSSQTDKQTDKFRRLSRLKICSSRFHIRRFVRLRRFVRPDDLFVQTICSSSSVKTAYASMSTSVNPFIFLPLLKVARGYLPCQWVPF